MDALNATCKSVFLIIEGLQALGPTQLSTQWVLGALSPGVKRLGREADYSN
jgi:hypothetical protein